MTVTLEQFLDNLVRSGLISAEELGHLRDRLSPARDAQTFAQELVREQRLTRFQARCLLQGKTRGLVLGKYVVLDEIGRGGMGQVYRARHCAMDRIVALKVLRPERMRSANAVDRFHREVRAAAKLEHPNIVTAHDAGEVDGTHFLVMQYVDGTDLARTVKREGPLPIAQAVDFVLQAARGLEYAHRQGIVHRDIKPNNLIVDRHQTVKILDMGLASIDQWSRLEGTPQTAQLTDSWQIMGTVEYMSPEQAEDTHAADHRTDIYSLGCTLYRLLTGQSPYEGETAVQILVAHRQDPIPSLRATRPDVPAQLDAVCRKMMAKQAADRQQSMTAVIADLEAGANVIVDTTRPPATDPVLDETLDIKADHDTVSSVVRRLSSVVTSESLLSAVRDRRPTLLMTGVVVVAFLLILGLCAVLATRPDKGADKTPVASSDNPGKVQDDGSSPLQGGNKTRVRVGNIRSSWEAIRTEAEARSQTLLDEQHYAQAQAVYSALMEQTNDAIRKARLGQSITQIQEQAAAAYRELENRARQLLAEKKYAEARSVLEPAVERFGIAQHVDAAKTLLAEITAAEAAAVPVAPPPPAQPSPEELAAQQELERLRALEAHYAEATKSAEMLSASWDFRGAAVALKEIQFAEAELTARLVQRHSELRRMDDLKQKIIAAINTASPPLRKSDLGFKGVGGNVTKADEDGVTTKLLDGKTETIPWSSIGTTGLDNLFSVKQLDRLLTPVGADDWLAAGLVALVQGSGSEAERCMDQARSLGTNIEPYLATLAAASFAEANSLLANDQYAQAEATLARIEQEYSQISWFPANQKAITAARDVAKAGIAKNQEAEDLFKEATRLLGKKELVDVKAIVEKLRSDYAYTDVVRDRGREPSLLDLEKAVANVPKAITVRLDGMGDFKSIQAAIDAAPSGSLIEIEDDGPYREKILIPKDKYELRLRGKKGCWPVITSLELPEGPLPLVHVEGSGALLERLVLLGNGLSVSAGDFRLRWTIIHGAIGTTGYQRKSEFEECLVTAGGDVQAPAVFRNCLFVGSAEAGHVLRLGAAGCAVHFCTTLGFVSSRAPPCDARNSILGAIGVVDGASTLSPEYCALLAGVVPEQSRSCFQADPMFVDPQNFDYRLKPGSPCIGKASDGGDIGCRYTPEIIELCKVALDLRRRGILKF